MSSTAVGFGAYACSGGFRCDNVSTSNIASGPWWQDNASEPFGRVQSTAQCFTRNGEAPVKAKWTPPSRPLFQSHAPALFGTSSNPPLGGHQSSSFGQGNTTPSTSSNSSCSVGAATTGFGSTKGSSGGGNNGTVFGSVDLNENAGFKGPRTVFGSSCNISKSVLALPSNPFATTSASVSISTPFVSTAQSPSWNDTAFKAPSTTTNPFAMKVSSTATVNPFAAKGSATPTVNPFSFRQTSGNNQNVHAVPGFASMKFKSGLRPVFKPAIASLWGAAWQQQQPKVPAKPASPQRFDWVDREQTKKSLPKVEEPFPMPNSSLSEMKTSLSDSSSSTAPASPHIGTLVASPDTNPYGSGSFGAGIIEEKIKTAIANPPSSVELKVLDDRQSSSTSRQQPSARFASRLGLARQPLQELPKRPVLPRYPTLRRRTASCRARAQLSQDPFRFSSSFSRLAISKKTLQIQVGQSSTDSPTAADPVDEIVAAVAKADDELSPTEESKADDNDSQ